MATREKKIVKLIKSLFNFNEPDSNLLIQKVEGGLIVKVYAGFKLAIEHSDGLISVHGPGLHFVPPLTTPSLVADHRLPREFKYNDNKTTKDNVPVEAYENISYEYSVIDDDSAIYTVKGEPKADAIIQNYVRDIVSFIVTHSNAANIKHGFDVSETVLPNWLGFADSQELKNMFLSVLSYGCKIDKIHICDFNEPKAIIDAETAAKAQKIQLETEMKKAEGERKIEKYRAETAKLVGKYHFDMLREVAIDNSLSPREVLELIKADLLKNSNVVNVMGSGSVDPVASAIYQRYCEQYSNNKGNATSEPIDASFEEAGPSFSK